MACSTQFMPFPKFNPRMQDATREHLSSKSVNCKLPRMHSRWCLANYSLIPCRRKCFMHGSENRSLREGGDLTLVRKWNANGYSMPLGYLSFFCWVWHFACSRSEISLYFGKREAIRQLLLEWMVSKIQLDDIPYIF